MKKYLIKHNYSKKWGRVLLSPLKHEDIEKLRVLRNKERNCFVYHNEIGYEDQINWFVKYQSKQGDFMFKVSKNIAPDIFIGAVALYNIDTVNGVAELGRLVIDTAIVNEKGLGFDTVLCILGIAFEQLMLSEIYLSVLNSNLKAIKTYERAGFIETSRKDDLMVMKITKNTFIKRD